MYGFDALPKILFTFTFHYVSILIRKRSQEENNLHQLYIPLCLYFNYTQAHQVNKKLYTLHSIMSLF